MTFFDRDQDLTTIEVREILDAMGDYSLLDLESPFSAELTTGRSSDIVSIRKEGETTVTFITRETEFPVARLEFCSLEKLVVERISSKKFNLK